MNGAALVHVLSRYQQLTSSDRLT